MVIARVDKVIRDKKVTKDRKENFLIVMWFLKIWCKSSTKKRTHQKSEFANQVKPLIFYKSWERS